MKTTHRAYAEAAGDFNLLANFIRAHAAHLRICSTWCLGRLVDWNYGRWGVKASIPGFCDQNANLWFDGFGDLAGLAISESGDAAFALLTAPGYQLLFEPMLDWALTHWGARPPHPTLEITERQALEAEALVRRGFQRGAQFTTVGIDLARELGPRYPLEAGFAIVDMAAHPDFAEQRRLRDDAFQGRSAVSEAELERELALYNYVHQGPLYHAPCDLCVRSPDGRFVAGCEALIDLRNGEADIERVCTRSGFRRRGFARAVIQECLVRLQALGLRRAYITGYSPEAIALYGSMGVAEVRHAFTYERATPEPAVSPRPAAST